MNRPIWLMVCAGVMLPAILGSEHTMHSPIDGPTPRWKRLRAIFDRALALPPAERVAFVLREVGDDRALADDALSLLGHAPTAASSSSVDEAARRLAPAGTSSNEVRTGERVRAEATEDLLAKLARSPRLDAARFAIEGEVGRGGMGAVFQVNDTHLQRRLAMKVMLGHDILRDLEQRHVHQSVGRFLEEAQVSSQLDHPGMVPVHDMGLDEAGRVWFTMRLVKGRTASEVFAEAFAGTGEWTLTRALEVVLKVCDTVAYAHEKGVLHRDLKPNNVMVGKFGEVYVMDWGLAKVTEPSAPCGVRQDSAPAMSEAQLATARRRDADSDTGSPVVTMAGTRLGTPAYMSPEQARGETVDVRTDVYSIGAMLYELAAGCAPYAAARTGRPVAMVLEDVVAGPPRRIEELRRGVAAELVAVVDKAMARDRARRYQTAAALAHDLRAFLGSQVVSAYRTGALVELRLWVRRNKPLAASLAAAVLILVMGIAVSTTLANENAALAQQKTELAAKEAKAREEAARRAEENHELAKSESEAKVAATRLAEEKGRTVASFHQLSAVVRLKDVLAKQDALWPAWPDKVAALREWLEKDCAQLLAQRPEIEATIAELRSRAVPLTAEQVEADRRAAAEWPAYQRQHQLVAALQRAQAIRTGASKLELPELPAALQNADASALNAFAWPRVAPEQPDGQQQDRTTFGEEAMALVAARAAVAKSAGTPEAFRFLDALAWAALANGQDEEAKQRSAEALVKAPAKEREAYLGHQRDIEAAIAEAAARFAAAEAKRAKIDAKVSVRRRWTFGGDEESRSAEFLHNALVGVVAGLNSMEAKEREDVAQRLTWAQQVESASITKYRDRWAEARQAILRADGVTASELYREAVIDLPPQMGLVPIGMNPVTKLWEFYDLRSAWNGKQGPANIKIPVHRSDGFIEVTAHTGIVFVLLPGGTVTIGSQGVDENAAFYDPQRQRTETLREVALAPFFLARHELTQGQWARLMSWEPLLRAPSYFHSRGSILLKKTTLANPVEQVDWWSCDTLLSRHGMVLPSEAQWEYGCRGGTTTPWIVPFSRLHTVANLADADAKQAAPQWECESWKDGHALHAPVGTFGANAFGLYDVHGNVLEWCRDHYRDPGDERPGDGLRPSAAGGDDNRCARGGSIASKAADARSSDRVARTPTTRSMSLGVRAARLLAR